MNALSLVLVGLAGVVAVPALAQSNRSSTPSSPERARAMACMPVGWGYCRMPEQRPTAKLDARKQVEEAVKRQHGPEEIDRLGGPTR